MDAFLVLILGLVVGSFLNAVIYRLHAGVSFVRGRSYCPHCKHDLSTWDLIPVFSFVMLRGKCRYCHKPISWQYPLVELATGLLLGLLWWKFGVSVQFFVYSVYTIFLIVMFVYDLRYYLILDRVSIPAMVVSAILSIVVLRVAVIDLFIGAVIGGGFFYVQYIISRGKWIGGGDIRLGVVMGLMLGYPYILIAFFIAYCCGSLVGIGLIVAHTKKWKSQVPFGTFLTAATIISFFFGERILEFYRGLIGL
ncbi:MAG: prepilin peptidase [Candidatus Kerfeldbacteria bacterium]|nr:prepilin peptidase [Candidatus Kerfeldbacteria bacterium]